MLRTGQSCNGSGGELIWETSPEHKHELGGQSTVGSRQQVLLERTCCVADRHARSETKLFCPIHAVLVEGEMRHRAWRVGFFGDTRFNQMPGRDCTDVSLVDGSGHVHLDPPMSTGVGKPVELFALVPANTPRYGA